MEPTQPPQAAPPPPQGPLPPTLSLSRLCDPLPGPRQPKPQPPLQEAVCALDMTLHPLHPLLPASCWLSGKHPESSSWFDVLKMFVSPVSLTSLISCLLTSFPAFHPFSLPPPRGGPRSSSTGRTWDLRGPAFFPLFATKLSQLPSSLLSRIFSRPSSQLSDLFLSEGFPACSSSTSELNEGPR